MEILFMKMAFPSQMKSDFDSKMVWGESEVNRGVSSDAEPCAKPGCQPFPTCCTTKESFMFA